MSYTCRVYFYSSLVWLDFRRHNHFSVVHYDLWDLLCFHKKPLSHFSNYHDFESKRNPVCANSSVIVALVKTGGQYAQGQTHVQIEKGDHLKHSQKTVWNVSFIQSMFILHWFHCVWWFWHWDEKNKPGEMAPWFGTLPAFLEDPS